MYNTKAIKSYEKAIALHQEGKLPGAERAYQKAIKINRSFVEAHNNLGNVFIDRGKLREASEAFKKALKLLPGHPMLLNNVGNVLQLQGKFEEAIGWFNKAITRDPNYAGAHSNLGNALRALGNFEEAAASYRRSIQIEPGVADRYHNLGAVLDELGELDEAFKNFKKAVEIDPGHKFAYKGLGDVLFHQDKLDEAIVSFHKAIEIDPFNQDAYHGLGNALIKQYNNALNKQYNIDSAVASYRKAIEIDPLHKDAYHGLGNVFKLQGELDNAIATFRKAIAIDPGFVEVYHALVKSKKYSEYDDDIRAMESLYATKDISEENKMVLAFSLGKVFEDLGEHEKAMEFILQATHLKRASFDYSISEEQDLYDNIKQVFSLEFFTCNKGSGNPDPTPIFILGMPRSGTSLVEQILASHPDVFGGGELSYISDLTGEFYIPDSSRKFPANIIDLDPKEFEDLGKKYIARIRKDSKESRYITDKMPHNFQYIGFIKAILPNARIIHLTRDPIDTCLSLFKNYFLSGHLYSYDLTELGQYYNLYLDLMEYWRNTLPGSIYDLSYERLVADQEIETRKLLEYCNLPWDEACLDFHKTRRIVNTTSNIQVRRPIYKDSVKLWKRYEKQLQPLVVAVNG